MEFTNEFAVPTDTGQAWSVLTDVPRIAPCLPGATVEPLDENSYSGTVAVKVGPIKASYAGTAAFQELDRESLRMVLNAQGKEDSGKGGSAAATVTVTLHSESTDKTRVSVHTDLQITGKLAQFGRNAMADVGARLITQFASNLESLLEPEQPIASGPAATEQQDPGGTPRAAATARAQQAEGELDAFTLALPLLKRALPSVAAFTLGVLLTWMAGRIRTSPAQARRAGPIEYAPS